MPPITLTAPAKLNLSLRLTGNRRADGRHELVSHFAPLKVADVLTLTPAPAFALSVAGRFADGVPIDARNLVWQAVHRFSEAFAAPAPVHIHLEKRIPHGAGLGGGSSDAGAVLAHLARAHKIPLDEVVDWSLCLGADVPFALAPQSRQVAGVGEIRPNRPCNNE